MISCKRITPGEMVWIFFLFLALGFLHLSPGSLHLTSEFIGPSMIEGPEYGWRMWWYPYALFVEKQNPFFCDMVFWPPGMDLTLQSTCFLKELVGGFLGGYRNPLVALNIITLLTLAANAAAAYYIGRRLLRARIFAFLIALFVAFSGSLNQNIQHLNILSMEGFILYCYFIQRWARDPRPGFSHALTLGLSSALAVACFIQNIVFVILFTLPFLGWIIVKRRLLKGHLFTLGMAAIIAVIINLPQLIPNAVTFLKHPEWAAGFDLEGDVHTFRFSLIQYILPWKNTHPLYSLFSVNADRFWGVKPSLEAFLGFIVLILTVLGWRHYPRKVTRWALPGILFLLFSLGPDLTLVPGGRPWLPLPLRLILPVPIINTVRNPSRYIIVTQICFGISAGYGAFALCRRLRKSGPFLKIKKHAVVLLCLLVSLFHMAELTLFPYPSSNPRHCPFYMVMRGDPDDVAVLDCPFHPGLQCYMYFTHLHRKRAVHGFGGRVWFPELRRHEDPYYIDKYLNETPVDAMPSYVERLAAGLEGANVRYVNIHKWLYSHPSSWKRIARFLEDSRFWKNRGNVRIEPVYEDGDNLIYRVFWRDREEQGMEGKGEARMEGKSPVGGE